MNNRLSEENKIFENLDIDQAYKEANRLFKKDAIKISNFSDLYGQNIISEDAAYVKKMEELFVKNNLPEQERIKKLAVIFEALIHYNVELNDWFGPNAFTIKTSRYDDIKNGIDDIVEFEESETTVSHLALAIDVTFSPEEKQKTFERIKKEIESGELAKVKYFQSDHINIRGELIKIPRVVIGADTKTIKRLGIAWLEKDNKTLGNDPIQLQILEEILIQLEVFRAYAERVKKLEIAEIYEKTHAMIQKIHNEKRSSIDDSGMRDHVFDAIKTSLDYF
ncbi:MAG: hypothetical protein QMD65_01580 [Patescibacteria group bacterium]|nr:hypothetical protein [Patescibacteria group bacterium]